MLIFGEARIGFRPYPLPKAGWIRGRLDLHLEPSRDGAPAGDRYKSLLQVKTASLIYFKQWTIWRNPIDEIEVRATDFLLEEPWRLILDETDRANVEFTELAWLRDCEVP